MSTIKGENKESEQPEAVDAAVPILTAGIGTRIAEASKLVGGKRRLAELITISETQLHRLIAGDSHSKVETIAEIAAATGVSLEWLAIGKGEKVPTDQVHEDHAPYGALQITPESLAKALAAVEKIAKKQGVKLGPKKRAKLALMVYEYALIQKAGEEADAYIERLVDLSSDT